MWDAAACARIGSDLRGVRDWRRTPCPRERRIVVLCANRVRAAAERWRRSALDSTARTVQCRPPATRRRREWPEETLSQALMPRGAEAAPHSGVIPEVRTPADLRSFRSSPPVRSYRGTGKNEPKAGRSHLPDPRPCTYVCTRCAHALVCRRQHAPSAGCCFNAKMQPGQSSS